MNITAGNPVDRDPEINAVMQERGGRKSMLLTAEKRVSGGAVMREVLVVKRGDVIARVQQYVDGEERVSQTIRC